MLQRGDAFTTGQEVAELIHRLGLSCERGHWDSSLLRQLLDAIPAPVVIARDSGCTVVYGNRAIERMLGAPSGANLAPGGEGGVAFGGFEILDAEDRPVARTDWPLNRAARGEERQSYEFQLRVAGGCLHWLYGEATPLRDHRGEPCGAVGTFVDISAMKRIEQDLLRANAEKSRLLAAVSHDLRQPVQGILLLTQVLAAQASGAFGRVVGKLQLCASVLSSQLENLMDLARVETGATAVRLQSCRVSEVIERVAETAAPQAAEKGLRLRRLSFDQTIRTDPLLFERLLANLVSNAIKYTVSGGVLIGCRRRKGRLLVQVVDSGIGIPPDKLGEIWNEFYQVDGTVRGGGAGLGLAIVDRTARLLGCRVEVLSKPSKGSTFTIEIPLP